MGLKFGFAAVAATVVAATVAGCGLAPASGTSAVSLTVSRNFGASTIGTTAQRHMPGSETVLRLLQSSFRVGIRYGGGVESIDGDSGSANRLDWYYYVNGVQQTAPPGRTVVHKGDRIWWDLHDSSATSSNPAVVGAFPEPFVHGTGGRRLPTVLECFADANAACNRVNAELRKFGVPVASLAPGGVAGTDSLAVIVGTWSDVRSSVAAALLQQGPSGSGVYAKFGGPSGQLELLDPHGHVVHVLGQGAGLIAASSESSAPPTWIVTGIDAAGVSAAANAMTPADLDNHFALAVDGSARYPVPVDGAS